MVNSSSGSDAEQSGIWGDELLKINGRGKSLNDAAELMEGGGNNDVNLLLAR